MDPEGLKAPLLSDYSEERQDEAGRAVVVGGGGVGGIGSGQDPPAISAAVDATSVTSSITGDDAATTSTAVVPTVGIWRTPASASSRPTLRFANVFGTGLTTREDWSLTSSLSSHDEDLGCSSISSDDDDSVVTSGYGATEAAVMSTFQRYSLFLGLFVGAFIQLSSLGANYLLSELYHGESPDQRVIVRFSLVWSIATSVLGVAVLLLIRVLLREAAVSRRQMQCHLSGRPSTTNNDREWFLHLECYFAVGTLAGVCLAWTCTDLLLGFRHHIYHSLGTLLLALVWWKVVSFYCNAMQKGREQQRKVKQLESFDDDVFTVDMTADSDVTVYPHRSGVSSSPSASSVSWLFIVVSLVLGLIAGLFIQFSSLGANFVLMSLRHRLPSNEILAFSLAWSVVASTMGVLMLCLARSLISMALNASSSGESSTLYAQDYAWLLRLEAFFAVGALFGVNIAWIATDIALGVQVQLLHSLWTELLALLAIGYAVRCRLLAAPKIAQVDAIQRSSFYDDDETLQLTVV